MGGELSPEMLQAEYEKLPPEELQMHMQACQAALQKLMAPPPMAAPGPEASMPPAGPPPGPGAGAPPPALKSEKATNDLKKSEAAAKAEVASLKEDIEILAKTVKAMLETPVRKAITSIADVAEIKEEPVQKSYSVTEFWDKLKEVAKRSDLKKSEKQLIKDIYDRRVQPETAAKQLAKLFAE
jgi:hypothetical protein